MNQVMIPDTDELPRVSASMPSSRATCTAGKCVDSNHATGTLGGDIDVWCASHSVCSTEKMDDPYLQLDLGRVYSIDTVTIYAYLAPG